MDFKKVSKVIFKKVGVRHLPRLLSALIFQTRSLLDLEFTDSTKQTRQVAPPSPHPQGALGIYLVPAQRELRGSTQCLPTGRYGGSSSLVHRELWGSTKSPPTGISGDPPSPCPVPSHRELWESTQSPPTLLLLQLCVPVPKHGWSGS